MLFLCSTETRNSIHQIFIYERLYVWYPVRPSRDSKRNETYSLALLGKGAVFEIHLKNWKDFNRHQEAIPDSKPV